MRKRSSSERKGTEMATIRAARRHGDGQLIAAVDVGGSKSVCLIGYAYESSAGGTMTEIVGVGRQGCIRERRRNNVFTAETSLRSAVEAAERMAGERIKSVYACVDARHVSSRRLGVDLDLEGGRVTHDDVADCMRASADSAAPDGYRPLALTPITFSIDGVDVGDDPIGLAGSVLTAELLSTIVLDAHCANIEALAARCGLRIDGFQAAPAAAAQCVLLEDEKDLGCVLIDIGAGSTGYAAFEHGALIHCGGVPVGGDHITRDLAQIFSAPLAHAERVKTLYGSALVGDGDEHDLVDMAQFGSAGETARVSRAEIAAVIAPRLEEIFEFVLMRLNAESALRPAARRAVLTGGGSLLVGARETCEQILKMKTRLGRPTSLVGAPEAATAPQFSACAGLIDWAGRQRTAKRDMELISAPPARWTGAGLIGGVGDWLRRNF